MAGTKEDAVEKARKDLAQRLKLNENDIKEKSVENANFPDTALGASTDDEMSGQMLTSGWRIHLEGGGQTFEYRADKSQLRLFSFKGKNYKI